MDLLIIIMAEWYSSLVYVEDRDVLYETCEPMVERVLDFIVYVVVGVRIGIFSSCPNTYPVYWRPKPFFGLRPKEGFYVKLVSERLPFFSLTVTFFFMSLCNAYIACLFNFPSWVPKHLVLPSVDLL